MDTETSPPYVRTLQDHETDPVCFFPSPRVNGIEANLQGFAFDGQYYWATVETSGDHPPGQIPPGKIMKLNPGTFEVIAEFDHPSTSPTGITYNPDRNVLVTNAALGGPPEAPWANATDFFFVHDPATLAVTAVYSAPVGTNDLVYDRTAATYLSVEVVDGTLSEHRNDDFAVIRSFRLPGAPHYPKGMTLIPGLDGGAPYILVTYYPQPTPGVLGPGQDSNGWMMQVLRIVDGELRVLDTLRANDGHIFAVGGLAWADSARKLVTVGVPWLQTDIGQVGMYLHDTAVGCHPLRGVPPWLTYSYLPVVAK